MKLLDFTLISFSVKEGKRKRDRPPRNPQAMLTAFIVMILKGYSERELATFLRNYPFWSRLCGFKGRVPCHATFSNFKRRVGEEQLQKAMKNLVLQVFDAGAIQLVKVAIDSSILSAALTDLEAKWGCSGKDSFTGIKHILCCADSQLPVAIILLLFFVLLPTLK